MDQFPDKTQDELSDISDTPAPVTEAAAEAQDSAADVNDEQSTIFSAPVAHNDRKPDKKHGRVKKIIAGALALALLVGGTIAVIRLIPVPEDETSSGDSGIKAVDLDSDNFEHVKLTNESNTLEFTSSVTEADGESTIVWSLDGYNAELIDSATVSQTMSELATITALREMSSQDADYGFDAPAVTAQVTGKNGLEDFTLKIGDTAPDESGVYLTISGSDKIYLVSKDELASLYENDLYYAVNTALGGIENTDTTSSYFQDSSLTTFDSITMSGKNFSKTLVIEPVKEKNAVSEYVGFTVTSPVTRAADNLTDILTSLGGGIGTDGAYSFDKSPDSLKRFGLDDPYFTAVIKVADVTRTYNFAKVDDTYYAVTADNDPLIRKVAASALSYINYNETNFYYKTMFLESISKLNRFTVRTGSDAYAFDIVYHPEDEENGTDAYYDISINGTALVADNFQNYYRTLLGIITVDYTTKSIPGGYDTTLTLNHSDGTADTVIGFKKYSEQRYQYEVNGTPMGQITSGDYSKILMYAKQIAAGEIIDVA